MNRKFLFIPVGLSVLNLAGCGEFLLVVDPADRPRYPINTCSEEEFRECGPGDCQPCFYMDQATSFFAAKTGAAPTDCFRFHAELGTGGAISMCTTSDPIPTAVAGWRFPELEGAYDIETLLPPEIGDDTCASYGFEAVHARYEIYVDWRNERILHEPVWRDQKKEAVRLHAFLAGGDLTGVDMIEVPNNVLGDHESPTTDTGCEKRLFFDVVNIVPNLSISIAQNR